MIRLLSLFFTVCCLFLFAGCDNTADGGVSSKAFSQAVVAIESGDECHLCGMLIGGFPGPKGESYLRRDPQVKKFCSTRDMLSFYLQPENTHQTEAIFVHDMAVTPWDHPDDDVFINARKAWYVAGSDKMGAMGPTLASFSTKDSAQAFIEGNGGRLLPFDEITLSLLTTGI